MSESEPIHPSSPEHASLNSRSARPGSLPLARLAALVTLPAGGLVGVMVGASLGVSGDQLTILSIAMLTITLGLAPLAIANARESGHVLVTFLGIVFIGYFAIPAITRYVAANGPEVPGSMGDQIVRPTDVIDGQLVVLAGLIALLTGYGLSITPALARRLSPPTFEWSNQSTLTVGFGMLIVGWTLTLAVAASSGSALLSSGFVGILATAHLFGLAPLYIAWYRSRSILALTGLVALVPLATVFGILTGSKREALNAAAIVAITHVLLRRRLAWSWVFTALLALTLLYPVNRFYQDYIVGAARASPLEALAEPDVLVEQFSDFLADATIGDHISSGFEAVGIRLDMLGVVSVLVRDTPRPVPFQKGKTIAPLLVAPIPRILWPNKPEYSVGLWVTEQYSHGLESHTAPTQIGEFYMNFGLWGVVLGLLLLGMTLRLMHELLMRNDSTAFALITALVFLYYLCTKFESAIAKQYGNILFAFVPLYLVHVTVRRIQGRSASN